MDKPWKIIAVLCAIFLAGGVTGALLSAQIGRTLPRDRRPSGAQAQNQPRRPIDAWGQQVRKRFKERLNLTAEQDEKIHALVQTTQEELRRLRMQTFNQQAEINTRLDAQIAEIQRSGPDTRRYSRSGASANNGSSRRCDSNAATTAAAERRRARDRRGRGKKRQKRRPAPPPRLRARRPLRRVVDAAQTCGRGPGI
jgi:hypothetical protein